MAFEKRTWGDMWHLPAKKGDSKAESHYSQLLKFIDVHALLVSFIKVKHAPLGDFNQLPQSVSLISTMSDHDGDDDGGGDASG